MTGDELLQDVLPPEIVRRLDECIKTKTLDECIAEIIFSKPTPLLEGE